jgi:hypothetical protein
MILLKRTLQPAVLMESKTAGGATPAVEGPKEINRIVARFHLWEARSKWTWGKNKWLSFSFVPPFLILEQYPYFRGEGNSCQEYFFISSKCLEVLLKISCANEHL